jgi:hypothetical protein
MGDVLLEMGDVLLEMGDVLLEMGDVLLEIGEVVALTVVREAGKKEAFAEEMAFVLGEMFQVGER